VSPAEVSLYLGMPVFHGTERHGLLLLLLPKALLIEAPFSAPKPSPMSYVRSGTCATQTPSLMSIAHPPCVTSKIRTAEQFSCFYARNDHGSSSVSGGETRNCRRHAFPRNPLSLIIVFPSDPGPQIPRKVASLNRMTKSTPEREV
jgi:hypothetical protein